MSNLIVDVIPFRPVTTLVESASKPGIFEVKGILQRAEAENQNGRVYKRSILERELKKYTKNFIEVGNAYGELDHPDSPIVSLKNASHVVKEVWWKGNDVMGTVQLLNTPAGNIVKNILRDGHTIGISSRGTGSVTQTNEGHLMVQDDFELVCWDFVSNPSTHGAFMAPGGLNESVSKTKANRYSKVHSTIREILCATTCECSLDI
jgi:hypothetical protein